MQKLRYVFGCEECGQDMEFEELDIFQTVQGVTATVDMDLAGGFVFQCLDCDLVYRVPKFCDVIYPNRKVAKPKITIPLTPYTRTEYGVLVDGNIVTEDQFGWPLTPVTADRLAEHNRGVSMESTVVYRPIRDYRTLDEGGDPDAA